MVINPIVGVYIPIVRIPIKGGMTIPNTATFDHGTSGVEDMTNFGLNAEEGPFAAGAVALGEESWNIQSVSIKANGVFG